MNAETPNVGTIFGRALEIESPSEREAFLQQACGDRPDMRAEVDELLRAHEQAGAFLQAPAAASSGTVSFQPLTEGPGTRIDRYKLLQQIGEGGFGVVFMAEQIEPIRRKVALKIIKPGMDSKQVIARFEAERQALALMDHPNIARVLDAGTTESGRPYFVMELVRGIPITDFCNQAGLTVNERLDLFVAACQAVHHAHQKGIVHRDIKPSNVLVTLHDDKPVVKVIDFGIAKATDHSLTERTLFTEFGQMIGTPTYMSPEQAGISGLDVNARTDVYSLGVLLYELLTGVTPFDQQRFRQAAYEEIRRIIREEEPLRPSQKLSALGEELGVVTSQRKTDARHLSAFVRGDIDWIVMKALEKDRKRRYESASDFAEDILRHTRHEPVKARPPSTPYRLRKFGRRNRVALTAGSLVITALGIGMAVSWLAHRGVKPEGPTVFLVSEGPISPQAPDEELDRLERNATELVKEKSFPEPEKIYKQLLEIRQTRHGANHRDTLRTRMLLANLRGAQGQLDEALQLYDAVLQDQITHLGKQDPDTQETVVRYAWFCLGQCGELIEKPNRKREEYTQAVQLAERALRIEPSLGYARTILAMAHYRTGNYPECLRYLNEGARFDPSGIWQYFDFAMVHHCLGNRSLALDWYSAGWDRIIREDVRDPWILNLKEESRSLLKLPSVLTRNSGNVEERILASCPRGPLTAEIQFRQGNVEAAEADVTAALQAAPELGHLYGVRGDMRARLGRFKDAEADYTRAAALASRDVWSYELLAILRGYLGDEKGYREVSRKLLHWKDSMELILPDPVPKVCCLMPVIPEDLPRVRLLADKLVGILPYQNPLFLAGGISEYRGGDFTKALDLLTRDQAKGEGIQHQVFLAMTQFKLDQREEAQKSVSKARDKIYTKFSQVGRGIPFRAKGSFEHSDYWWDWLIPAAVFPEAVQLVEGVDQDAVRTEMTTLLGARTGNPDAPIGVLTKALERNPDSVTLVSERGNWLGQKGRWKEAARDLKVVVKQNPTDAYIAMVLGYVLGVTDLPAYREHCRTMRRNFNNPGKWWDYGFGIAPCVLHPSVEEDWQALARQAEDVLGRSDPWAVPWLKISAGLAWYRAGRMDDALRNLEWAWEDQSEMTSGRALLSLSLCYSHLKKLDKAKDCLKKGLEAIERHFPGAKKGDLSPTWHEWLACDLLRREAETALGAASGKNPTTGPKAKD